MESYDMDAKHGCDIFFFMIKGSIYSDRNIHILLLLTLVVDTEHDGSHMHSFLTWV